MAESAFLELMPLTVTVVRRTQMDKYGRKTWRGQFTEAFTQAFGGNQYRCRIQDAEVRDREVGNQTTGNEGVAYLLGDADVDTECLLLLPDGTSPVVTSVAKVYDESGVHHTVVRFAK